MEKDPGSIQMAENVDIDILGYVPTAQIRDIAISLLTIKVIEISWFRLSGTDAFMQSLVDLPPKLRSHLH